MSKTRKNLRSVKRGGNNNNNNNNNKNSTPRRKIPYNWRPTRRRLRPVYLNSKLARDKIYKKYVIDRDSFDLSHFQNILLTGSDREKEDAKRDLNMLFWMFSANSDLPHHKDVMKSIMKLLKETDFEITTTNPLVYKKTRNNNNKN
jgi:Fe-S oxidoreductase